MTDLFNICDRNQLSADSVLLASAVRAATTNTSDVSNNLYRSVTVNLNVSAVPGIDTITPVIQGKDPISGTYYTLLSGAAILLAGLVTLQVSPTLIAVANLIGAYTLPTIWRLRIVHSGAGNFTYSANATLTQ